MSSAAGSSAKVAIWTAIVTATATVLTAFIAIVPQMRHTDQQQIQQLTSQVSNLTAKSSKDSYVVKGQVKTKKDNAPVKEAILVAAAAGDSAPLDDAGGFVLPNMLNQAYWIVVQTPDGKTSRVLIDPSVPETDTADLAIVYSFSKE
jgi:mannitol-specific phosphotransferase system IIBC component